MKIQQLLNDIDKWKVIFTIIVENNVEDDRVGMYLI